MEDTRHARICRSVVAISISEILYTDGIVVTAHRDKAYIIADPHHFKGKEVGTKMAVVLPNMTKVNLRRENIQIAEIVLICCVNPRPGEDIGLEELIGIDFCEQIQENDKVYTFSNKIKKKLLTPGRIILKEDEKFDTNCGADYCTSAGAPVINEAGQFVGMCTSYNGYLTAFNAKSVSEMIDNISCRLHTTVAATIQYLLQPTLQ